MAKKYDLSSLSFLVVDNNNYMITILKTLLRGYGIHKICDARDAGSAFEELQNNPVDIILLDCVMDTLSGIEFTRLARTAKDSPNPYIPIIMISAYTERSRVYQARDVGITEFIQKPLSATSLYNRIIHTIEFPRQFVRTPGYFGPDRRHSNKLNYEGEERRKRILKLQNPKGLKNVKNL